MKLPYRAGDSFALPLGNGSHARANIVACGHHTVDIAVEGIAATIRTSDRALVLHRWRRVHDGNGEMQGRRGSRLAALAPHHDEALAPHHDEALAPHHDEALAPHHDHVSPARVERIVATHLGVAQLEQSPLILHEGRFTPDYACAHNDEELHTLAGCDVQSLIVAGSLTISAIPALFPGLRALRIAVRDWLVDARAVAENSSLEILSFSGVRLEQTHALAELARLRALRVARIPRFDVRELDDVCPPVLAFESIADLRGVRCLAERSGLVQLELLDAWPCELADVIPLAALPRLVRAEIDIGGRRKNVELYRRANWAYPWPLELY